MKDTELKLRRLGEGSIEGRGSGEGAHATMLRHIELG